MNTLANRRFVKMNGLGNEIVVVDLRGEPPGARAADPAEVRAAAGADGAPCDQFMLLYPARMPGTDVSRAAASLSASRRSCGMSFSAQT